MTLTLLELVSVVLVPLCLGAALLRLQGVVPRTDPLGYLGWAWLQGSVGVGVVLSGWLWLELPLRAGRIAPAVLACAAVAFAAGRRVRAVEGREPAPARGWERAVFGVALALLLLSTVDRILLASGDVLVSSDEARIWAAKAKVLFHAGGFGPVFAEAVRTPEVMAHPDYPPLNPLLQVWVHAHAGEIVHVESRLPIQAFALAGILVAASAVRRRARPLVATAFLVCLGTVGRFFTYQVFSDALIAIGLLACWDLFQRYQEDGERVWLRLLGCTAPVLVWSKNEGVLQVLVLVVACGAAALAGRLRLPARGERWRALAWAVPLVLSVLYLRWFNAHFGLVNDLLHGSGEVPDLDAPQGAGGFAALAQERAGDRVRPILACFAGLIATDYLTRYFLLAFLCLALVSPRAAFARGRAAFTLALLLGLAGYMAVYLGTHWEIEAHLKHSAHRLVYHLTPAAGLWVLCWVVEALPRLAAGPARDERAARALGPSTSST